MSNSQSPRVVALEEHYWDPAVVEAWGPAKGKQPAEQLLDVGDKRVADMDAAGIDVQVLSMGAPAMQAFGAETAVPLASAANDRLKAIVDTHPDRYAGFATLPTAAPEAAADELERAVKDLGFCGAMLHGLSHEQKWLDLPEFWPIYARAEALDVPIYFHPALPHPAVVGAYLKDYIQDYPEFIHAGWGFTIETATQGVRLVLSGLFDKHPGLKVILGHMGEGLPFLLWRINHAFSRGANKTTPFREIFQRQFYVTTSGNFSDPALQCTITEMGVDRILFSVDYPYVQNHEGSDWIKTLTLPDEDVAKICSGNAERLLKI